MTKPKKVNLQSQDVVKEKLKQLKELFPEVFSEGKVNFDELKRVLGESVESGRERFGLNWPGKAESIRIIQEPSIATLKPMRSESVDFDTTENLFIEGDNLEVLKLLQKSYFGKVKMIYIDPPYNTGNDFIYPDKYGETLDTYLKYTDQKDTNGNKFSTNTDTDGRYHSRWLNMMYPRLYLAKSLLRDDGVIFISIDDNEQANLKALCNQVFGEENHLVTMYIQVRYPGKTLAEKNDYQKLIEQVLVYKKRKFLPIKDAEKYSIEKFCWNIIEKNNGKKEIIGGKDVEIFYPGDYEIKEVPASIDALKETWATGTVLKGNASGKYFGKHLAPRKQHDGLSVLYKVQGIGEDGFGYRYFTGPRKETATKGKFFSGVPTYKREEIVKGEAKKKKPILNFYDFAGSFGNCRHEGNVAFRNGKKPVEFLKNLLKQSVFFDENAIILDFFAGSSSTAHAVMDINKDDNGNRKYIMVQLPENALDDEKQDGFNNISTLSIERIRRAAKKIEEEQNSKPDSFDGRKLDLGFKVFKLSRSNFKIWESDAEKIENLEGQLFEHVNHIDADSASEDILYELLLKKGFPLTTQIEKVTMAKKDVFSIEDGDRKTLICLDKELDQTVIDAMAKVHPKLVICLDKGFNGNDQLKTNTVETFKTLSREKELEIMFETV